MGYDERLFERITDALERKDDWTEKDMFGGRVCLTGGIPFIGVVEGGIVALTPENARSKHLELRHCSPFIYRGKELTEWTHVSMEALKTAKQLSRWVDAAYNYAREKLD